MSVATRFGAQTIQQNVTWTELLDFWRFLEDETRIESVWLMDHLVPPLDQELSADPCFNCEVRDPAGSPPAGQLVPRAAHSSR
jgi:hypothetical protein